MLIHNVHIENSAELSDVRVEKGRFSRIDAGIVPYEGEEIVDGREGLLIPPFVDSHVHLDATLTEGQPEWNETGTLFDGIRIWSTRKKSLSIDDVTERAEATILKMVGHGIQYIRTHVDVTDSDLTALRALLALQNNMRRCGYPNRAFPQEGILSFPNGKKLMESTWSRCSRRHSSL